MSFTTNLPPENTDPWYSGITSAWAALKSFVNDLETDIAARVTTATYTTGLAAKADLVGGLIPTSQLPPLAITSVSTVASQAAMLALTAETGDVAIRSDLSNQMYILTASPASTLANWVAFSGTGSVNSVAGKTGTVLLVKGDVGLGNVDNTSDVNKPVSTLQAAADAAAVTAATNAALDESVNVAGDALTDGAVFWGVFAAGAEPTPPADGKVHYGFRTPA